MLLRIFWPSFWTWFAELDSDHAQFAIAALTAAVIGACVGSPQAQWLFQPMLEPNIDWMWVEPADRPRDVVTAPRAVVVGLLQSSSIRRHAALVLFCTLVAVARSFVTV